MSDSHSTCEDGSILTRACIKSSPVAFALHLSIDGSATYSRHRGNLSVTPLLGGRMKRWLLAGTLALAAGGQGLASDLPPPPRRRLHAPRRLTRPRWSRFITGAGSISASIWATALARAIGRSHRSWWYDRQFQSEGFPHRRHDRRQFPDRFVCLRRRGRFRRLLYRWQSVQPVLQRRDAVRDQKFLVFDRSRAARLCCRSRTVLWHGRRRAR